MNKEMVRELEKLGFTGKQSTVYVALLGLGKATAAELGRKTGINRTSIYDIIGELQGLGLVSLVAHAKKQTYRAESPEKLPVILEAQAARMHDMAKQSEGVASMLQSVVAKAPNKPKIKIYEGESGIKSLYDASLLCRTSIKSFLNADALESFDADYAQEYFAKRARKGIIISAIINDCAVARGYKKVAKEFLRDMRLVSTEKMDIVPEVYIYDNTVAIFSLKERLGVSIESKDIAYAFRKLYDLAWEKAGEYNSNSFSAR